MFWEQKVFCSGSVSIFLSRNVFGAECLCTGPKRLEICLYNYLLKFIILNYIIIKFKLFCYFCKVKVWLIKSFATDIKLKKWI